MIYQNDPAFPWWFQKYGCFVRSLLRIPEVAGGPALTVPVMLSFHDEAVRRKLIKTDLDPKTPPKEAMYCFLLNAEAALTLFLDMAGLAQRASFVGEEVFVPRGVRLSGWGRNAGDFAILEGAMANPPGFSSHFRLGGRTGEEIFDPHHPQVALKCEVSRRWIELRRK